MPHRNVGHRFHPRSSPGWRYNPYHHAFVADGYGGGDDVVVWRPDLVFYDPRGAIIGVGADGTAIMVGWGFSDLASAVTHAVSSVAQDVGKGAAGALGQVSNVATQIATKPGTLALHALGGAVSLVNKDAGKYFEQGVKFVEDQQKLGEQMFGGALRAIGSGQNVLQALGDSGHLMQKELKEVGPYAQIVVSMVPGVGTAVGTALATGIALANGKPITEAMMDGLAGAMPGGAAAQMAFKMGRSMVSGKNVLESAISVAREQLPKEAQAALDFGVAIAKGKNIQDAVTDGVRRVLPKEAQAAFDAGKDILHGRIPSPQAIAAFAGNLPPEATAALGAATKIMQGQSVLDVAKNLATDPSLGIPPEARAMLSTALTAAHGHSLSEAAKSLALQAMPASMRKDAEAALAVASAAGSGGIEGAVRTLIAKGAPPEAAAALSAVDALRSGDPMAAAKKVAAQFGGSLPPAAAQLLSTASSIAAGKNPIEVAKAAALNALPPDAQAAAKTTLAVLDGKGLEEAKKLIPSLGLPPAIAQYATAALHASQGANPTNAALAVVRRALPPHVANALDAAVSTGKSQRPQAVAMVKAADATEQLEQEALVALRKFGFDPRRVTVAEIVAKRGRVRLPAEVLLMIPEVAEGSKLFLAVRRGDPAAKASYAAIETATREGDVDAAKKHEGYLLAKEAHEKGSVELNRGLKAAEIRAMITIARRARAA